MDDARVSELERRLSALEHRVWREQRLLVALAMGGGAVGTTWHLAHWLGWPAWIPVGLAVCVVAICALRAEDEDTWAAEYVPPLLAMAWIVVGLMTLAHWFLAR